MSGILGLVGRGTDRPSASAVVAAARCSPFRGEPTIHDADRIVIGTYGSGRCSAPDRGSEVVALDGRIDAALPGSGLYGAPVAGDDLLWHALRKFGPQRLDAVAGDYAVAQFNRHTRSLTLARDAFGLRPLYWARARDMFAFASDPEVLIALGLADGSLQRDRIWAYLGFDEFGGDRTAFAGIRRLPGGTWLRVDRNLEITWGRWFHPHRLPVASLTTDLDTAVAEAVADSVRSRCAGRRTVLSLSGGVDSGALAVALARTGIRATCLTSTFPSCREVSEANHARTLALASGHTWRGVPAPAAPERQDLERLARILGTPLGFPVTQPLTLLAGAVEAGAEVFIDGEGGEPLFNADPVILRDLLRAGRFSDIWPAVQAFRRHHATSAPDFLRAVLRPLGPARPLRGAAHRPPWVASMQPARNGALPRSDRQRVCQALATSGMSPMAELWERLLTSAGIEYASPLLDLRVVQIAMLLPIEDRLPIPRPKPVLRRVFLGAHEQSRTKMSFLPYYRSYARRLQHRFPELTRGATLSPRMGLVLDQGLGQAADAAWALEALRLATVETWLGLHNDREVTG